LRGRWRSQTTASVTTMPSCAHTSTDVHLPGDRPSGCFSNECGQQALRVEILDTKREIHRAFVRPAARRRDRGEMRGRPTDGRCAGNRGRSSCRSPKGSSRSGRRIRGRTRRSRELQGRGGRRWCHRATLLPFGIAVLAGSLLGLGNLEIIGVLFLFDICLAILMLFAGYTQIAGLSERAATVCLLLALIGSGWLSKIIFAAIM
jgi:hypothetical protein